MFFRMSTRRRRTLARGLAGAAVLQGFSGCAALMDDPSVALPKLTGLHVCEAAIVRYIDPGTDEIVKFDISADVRRCNPSLATSVIEASGGGCRAFFETEGNCGYQYEHHSVAVFRQPSRVGWLVRYRVEAL